jgi:DNA uptake protein ComE-like DNA-binding protein
MQVAARPAPADEPARSSASGARVDLNTGSIEALNNLDGGGRIGRAIVNGRPYAAPEDLMRKKILSRATFERIRAQIEVR